MFLVSLAVEDRGGIHAVRKVLGQGTSALSSLPVKEWANNRRPDTILTRYCRSEDKGFGFKLNRL